jgi:hypothetical protein
MSGPSEAVIKLTLIIMRKEGVMNNKGFTIILAPQYFLALCCMMLLFSGCETDYTMCGGIAGFQCPEGMVCIDDPRDACCPRLGDADCSGICVPGR